MHVFTSIVWIDDVYYLDVASVVPCHFVLFFFKQKTADELRISDWSSDVCSSDLAGWRLCRAVSPFGGQRRVISSLSDCGYLQTNVIARFGKNADSCPEMQELLLRCEKDGALQIGEVTGQVIRIEALIVEKAVDRKSTRLNSSH